MNKTIKPPSLREVAEVPEGVLHAVSHKAYFKLTDKFIVQIMKCFAMV